MDEFDSSSFIIWSVITGIIMLVTGLSYRRFLKLNNKTSS